jgi:hypothetical protein
MCNCIHSMGSNMFYNICYNIKLYKIVKDWLWQLLWDIWNPIVWIQLYCILPCLKNIVMAPDVGLYRLKHVAILK